MKNLLACAALVLALILTSGPSGAAEPASRLTQGEITQLLGSKLFALEDASVASERGHLFLLARDRKTRQLEWFLLDPSARRVLKQGKVPFQVYRGYAVAPDGRSAVAHARYPSALWTLSLDDGRWTCAQANDNPERLVLTSLSGLLYTDAQHAASILDRLDAEGYVTDSIMVRFATRPFSITDRASLQELEAKATEMVAASAPAGMEYDVDLMRYGGDGSFVFVLQSAMPEGRTPRTINYLFRRAADGTLKLLDQGETALVPLDFEARNDRLLYRTAEAGKPVLALLSGGHKTLVARRPVVAAALLGQNRIATVSVVGNQLEVSTGAMGHELRKAHTVNGLYRASFLEDGRRLLLWNDRDVRIVPLP